MDNPEIRYCQYCGTELSSDSRYCKKCGCEIIQARSPKQFALYSKNGGKIAPPETSQLFGFNKLIECKTCGEKIAKTAKACPHCGAKTTHQLVNETVTGVVGGLLAFPLILGLILFFAIVFMFAK